MSDAQGRDIPEPIKREVRQRCGFGCVVCGMPLYEYEHMLGFANVQRHVADEITLLCDSHHRELTGGLLPMESVREANRQPLNHQVGVSKPYDLHYTGEECEVSIGSNTFRMRYGLQRTAVYPIVIDEVALLSFTLDHGQLLLNALLFDDDNRVAMHISENQLVYSMSPWDITLIGRTLTIREAAGRFLLEIRFEVPNRIVVERGRFLRNGVEVIVRPDSLLLTNKPQIIVGNTSEGVQFGLLFGPSPPPGPFMLRVDAISRYVGDNRQVLQWREDVMAEIGSRRPTEPY